LSHPAACTGHGLGDFRGQPFLILEWIEGQTLRALAGPQPDLARLLSLVLQVAGALRAAHAAGIVHRDIKPENLMVRADGYVKVLDFGLVRCSRRPTGSGLPPAKGSPTPARSSAPALHVARAGRGELVDGATDVFSLGTSCTSWPPAGTRSELTAVGDDVRQNETPLPPDS
jgi:serine/threonine-protein kinase